MNKDTVAVRSVNDRVARANLARHLPERRVDTLESLADEALRAYDTQNPSWQPGQWFERLRAVRNPPPAAEPSVTVPANDLDPESLEQADA